METLRIKIEVEAPDGFFTRQPKAHAFANALTGIMGALGADARPRPTNVGEEASTEIPECAFKVSDKVITPDGVERTIATLGLTRLPFREKKDTWLATMEDDTTCICAYLKPAITEEQPKEEAPKPKRSRKATEQAAAQEEAKEETKPITLVDIRTLSVKKDDKNASPGGNRFAIKSKIAEFGAGAIAELLPEHYSAMFDFLNTLKDS